MDENWWKNFLFGLAFPNVISGGLGIICVLGLGVAIISEADVILGWGCIILGLVIVVIVSCEVGQKSEERGYISLIEGGVLWGITVSAIHKYSASFLFYHFISASLLGVLIFLLLFSVVVVCNGNKNNSIMTFLSMVTAVVLLCNLSNIILQIQKHNMNQYIVKEDISTMYVSKDNAFLYDSADMKKEGNSLRKGTDLWCEGYVLDGFKIECFYVRSKNGKSGYIDYYDIKFFPNVGKIYDNEHQFCIDRYGENYKDRCFIKEQPDNE